MNELRKNMTSIAGNLDVFAHNVSTTISEIIIGTMAGFNQTSAAFDAIGGHFNTLANEINSGVEQHLNATVHMIFDALETQLQSMMSQVSLQVESVFNMTMTNAMNINNVYMNLQAQMANYESRINTLENEKK